VIINRAVSSTTKEASVARLESEHELTCPCCGAILVIDVNLGRIVEHREPPGGARPDLNEAHRILAEEATRRNALFEQSVEQEKTRGDALSKRFEEALKQAKKEPISRPMRGFDLD
jgi:hypothetical protein